MPFASKKFFCRMVFYVAFFIFSASGDQKIDSRKPLRKVFPGLVVKRQEAEDFGQLSVQKRLSIGDLSNECCSKACNFEERAEFAESWGWERVGADLCKLSVQEGKSCRCKARAGHYYECGVGKCDPCPNKYNCGGSWNNPGKCITNDRKCDSRNDCGSWQDEKNHNCKFPNSATIALTNGHWGSVLISGWNVCDDDWDVPDVRVLCRNLGFSDDTHPFSTRGSFFDKRNRNYIIDDVKCSGWESKLRDCPHNTWNNCDVGVENAGAICVDPHRLTLEGGNEAERYGNVHISGDPVCHNNWDLKSAQVVCNQKYKSQFQIFGRMNMENVPVFKATDKSEFGTPGTDNFIMQIVECLGTEPVITQCPFYSYNHEQCDRSDAVGVMCAKCTPNDFLNMIDMVKRGTTLEESRQNVEGALTKLKLDCYDWDCSTQQAGYPEYCQVRAFLENTVNMLKPDVRKQAIVSLKYDHGIYLNNIFDKEQNAQLMSQIDSLTEQTADFQTSMAKLYQTMSDFEKGIAKADYEYSQAAWNGQKLKVAELQSTVGKDLGKLFDMAFFAYDVELVKKAVAVAKAAAAMIAPLDAVANPGNLVKSAGELASAIADLADTYVDKDILNSIFRNSFPRLGQIAKNIADRMAKNKDNYDEISQIVGIENHDLFTEEHAKKFLAAYGAYTPAISAADLAEYKVVIDEIVGNLCKVVNEMAKRKGAKLCLQTQQNVGMLKDLLGALSGKQLEIMDAFADFAKAKVKEMAASELSQVLLRSSKEFFDAKIADKNAGFLFQIHKMRLINNACDYIMYMHFGVEQEMCKTLRTNTFGDLAPLIAFKYDRDIMCSDKNTRRGTFTIPARLRTGSESLSKGVLDLTQLMDSSQRTTSAIFQIPDEQWLVDNDWIYADEVGLGPYTIKKLQLHALPTLASGQKDIFTSFKLLNNSLGDGSFAFDEEVFSKFQYQEENPNCELAYHRNNPYNVLGCKELDKVCVRSDGLFIAPMYPSLMASWNVGFSIEPQYKSVLAYPAGDIRLKVEAEFCFRQTSTRTSGLSSMDQGTCCASTNFFTNKQGVCQECPDKSSPRLNGYFCESCPAGYEPRDNGVESYGCTPCGVDTFKSEVGNAACVACGANTSTDSTVGNVVCS